MGVHTLHTHDALGRMTAIDTYNASAAVPEVHAAYTWDAANRVTAQAGSFGTGTYAYDGTNQLVASDVHGDDEHYVYDPNGNRVESAYGTYTVNPDNRVGASPNGVGLPDPGQDATYTHDSAGNLTGIAFASGATRRLGWDGRNRLVGFARFGEVAATYSYDGLNRRTARQVNYYAPGAPYQPTGQSEAEAFVWDGDDLLFVARTGGDRPGVERYLMGEGQNVVVAEDAVTTHTEMVWDEELQEEVPVPVTVQAARWALTDQVGSVQALVVNTAVGGVRAVVWIAAGDSFGTPAITSAGVVPFRMRFTGYQFDPESGLYYANARYYNPRDGRFISKDPLSFDAGDTNVYRYVGNHPTWGRDPTGLYVYPYTSTNGIAAHAAFSAWAITQGLTPISALVEAIPSVGRLFADLAPDALNMKENQKEIFELKPITHLGGAMGVRSSDLQAEDYAQMLTYRAALGIFGYTPGDQDRLVPESGLPIMIIKGDYGEELRLTLYRQNKVMKPSGLDGRGFILYTLEPVDDDDRKRRRAPVPDLVLAPSNRTFRRYEAARDESSVPSGVIDAGAATALTFTFNIPSVKIKANSSQGLVVAGLTSMIGVAVLLKLTGRLPI